MGAVCCRAPRNKMVETKINQRPPLPPDMFEPAPLRRPVPIRAKLGSTTYEKLAESTEYGVAEYRQLGAMQSTGYTWRPGCAEK